VQETFRLCQKYLDGVVLVDNARISAAIKDMFTETRTILEPAGALALAGAKAYLSRNNLTVLLLHVMPARYMYADCNACVHTTYL
jgi:threonine dehydratase